MTQLTARVLLVLMALSSQGALAGTAGIRCTNEDPSLPSVLTILNFSPATASAALDSIQGIDQLTGTFHALPRTFSSSSVEYDLLSLRGEALKIVVSYQTFVGRGGCGRGGCLPEEGVGPAIFASYKVGDKIESFTCETFTQK